MPTHYRGTEDEERCLNAFIYLTRAFNTVDKKATRLFADYNLTSGQFGVLEAIHHLGPMHQGTLGEKLLQSKGNITTIVNNLEDRDLVERRRDEEDRRYVTVHLTEQGESLIRDVFPEHVRRIVDVMSVLSDEEIETLGRLCRKLGLRNREGASD
jgi:MarR family 2-MHQ and catechol resistance regulon transcriptional repressor